MTIVSRSVHLMKINDFRQECYIKIGLPEILYREKLYIKKRIKKTFINYNIKILVGYSFERKPGCVTGRTEEIQTGHSKICTGCTQQLMFLKKTRTKKSSWFYKTMTNSLKIVEEEKQ